MESYLNLFLKLSFAVDDPSILLSLLILALARLLPIIGLAPFFGSRTLPHPVKVTLGICLGIIFLPQMAIGITQPIGFNTMLIFLFIKELFIGFALGFMISMPFNIASNAGIIIDHQRGGASLMVNDPTIQNQSSPLGTLFNLILIYLFFMMDGPFLFLDALATSYEVVPVDRFFSARFFAEKADFWKIQRDLFTKVMVLSTQLATPGLLAILMTDVFLGIVNRLAPQVQITFLGMPLKSLLGLGVVTFGWKLFCEELVRQNFYWIHQIRELLHSFTLT